jgi:hypothetical protein
MKLPSINKIEFFNRLEGLVTHLERSKSTKTVKFFSQEEVRSKFHARWGIYPENIEF